MQNLVYSEKVQVGLAGAVLEQVQLGVEKVLDF
jgi:hypothetical protein